MKYPLLVATLLVMQAPAYGQTPTSEKVRQQYPLLPALPEAALQATATVMSVATVPGTRFQYQLLRVQDNEAALLAPAWRGLTRLVPDHVQNGRRLEAVEGSLEAKVMLTLNELSLEGWELLQVYDVSRPVRAQQEVETSLRFADPNRPVQTGTTTISSYTETRYLLRRPLAATK